MGIWFVGHFASVQLFTFAGVRFWPSADKIIKWVAAIDRALETVSLCGGEASKLSGQLQWAAQHAFKRLGRAMLRPIIV